MYKKKSKKGDITDMLSLIVIAFAVIVGLFVIAFIIPYITTGLSNSGLNNTPEGANAIRTLYDYGTDGIQRGVTWLFFGLCMAILISAFYSDTHPIWFFLFICFLIVEVIIAGYLANAYETMVSLDVFNNFQQNFLTTIMQHSVKIYIAVALLSFIIMFTKWAYMGRGDVF